MKQVIQTSNAPAPVGAYSQAVQVGNTIYLSGQIPLDPKTMAIVSDDFTAQANQVFNNLKAVCEAAGGDLNALIKLTVFLMDISNAAHVNEIMQTYFSLPYPARSMVQVAALPKAAKLEIEAVMVI